jgi:DNA-directed RNA polymerase specialized sigma24 family protein
MQKDAPRYDRLDPAIEARIEGLFVDPVEAAGERMQEQLAVVRTTMLQLHDAHRRVHGFAEEYIDAQSPIVTTAPQAAPAQLEAASQTALTAATEPDIITLRERDGMSFEEIGERLGITRQSATARYNRAKALQ